MAILNNSNAISSGGYDINNSLRIRGIDASAYLNRTPAGAGNRRTWTYSAWIKRGNITPAAGGQSIFYAGSSTSTPRGGIVFGNSGTDNKLSFNGMLYNTTTQVLGLETSAEFRDPSAWYHIVVVLDTTQATSSDRAKIYVNGSQVTAFGTATYPSLNQELQYNDAILHATRHPSGDYEYDGYLAEVNFIDGQALTPSSFGETDTTTGSWKPKAYGGTFGTNGFYLKFSDIATTSGSNAGLGKDFSGNANYWTTNNISVTAGTTYDAMIDSPTLTSATVANYAVMNPLAGASTMTLLNGNLNTSGTTLGLHRYGTIGVSSGKYYWEASPTAMSGTTNAMAVGISNDIQETGTTFNGIRAYLSSDGKAYTGTSGATYGATWTTNDIIGMALDLDAGTLVFYKNNVSQGTAFTGLTGQWFPLIRTDATVTSWINFGQRPFTYTPPTGFVRLNTYNLPDSTIKKGNTVMDATLWTGNGASSRAITNAGSFKPDLVWTKSRSGANPNVWIDSNRGLSKYVISNSTAAEGTDATLITSLDAGGFTIGSDNPDYNNYSGDTYVGWQWQAGQGSTSSNTSGSITSTVSVNATAGFSIVTYTSNNTGGATVGHGLGVKPSMIILKRRPSTSDWDSYHTSLGATKGIALNSTAAATTSINFWNNTEPTSTVFTLGAGVNPASTTMLAYCWAEIAGFSKFTSYTGNGSADGPFVYLGFRPKFVMVKSSSGVENWMVMDSSRDSYNVSYLSLFPNLSNAETSGTGRSPQVVEDFLSNGFKIRGANNEINTNGGTYIVAAWAENPFKNSNAR
jgi:hypothetical protein